MFTHIVVFTSTTQSQALAENFLHLRFLFIWFTTLFHMCFLLLNFFLCFKDGRKLFFFCFIFRSLFAGVPDETSYYAAFSSQSLIQLIQQQGKVSLEFNVLFVFRQHPRHAQSLGEIERFATQESEKFYARPHSLCSSSHHRSTEEESLMKIHLLPGRNCLRLMFILSRLSRCVGEGNFPDER